MHWISPSGIYRLDTAAAVIVEEVHPPAYVDGGRNDVEQAVTVKVLHDAAAGLLVDVQARRCGDFCKRFDVVIRNQSGGGHSHSWRNRTRITIHRHRGDVEQPLHDRIVGAGPLDRVAQAEQGVADAGIIVGAGRTGLLVAHDL